MRSLISYVLVPVMAMAITGAALAAEVTYSYATGEHPVAWGSSTAERYSIAITIPGEACAGLSVKSITVPVAVCSEVSDLSIWLASELALDGSAPVTDLGAWTAAVPETAEGDFANVTLTLPEPVNVPTDGLYAGYSFNVSGTSSPTAKAPVEVSPGFARAGGLWMYATRSNRARWSDRTSDAGGVSTMSVTLEGNIMPNSVEILRADAYYAAVGSPRTLDVLIANRGLNAVESVGYTCTVAAESYTGTARPATPCDGVLGAQATVTLQAPDIDTPGLYPLQVEITSVNGDVNAPTQVYADAAAARILPFLPVNRPLVEESTGTTCGNCPKGIAAIDYMNEHHRDDFLAVSWHTYDRNDPMYPASGSPNALFGNAAPVMYFNRTVNVDCYAGFETSGFGLDKAWEKYHDSLTPVEVQVTALWSDDDPEAIDVEATVRWALTDGYAPEGFIIDYILVGDGLCGDGPEWIQYNGMSSMPPSMAETDPILAPWILAPDYVTDMVYNDVGLIWVGGATPEYDADLPPIAVDAPAVMRHRIDTRLARNAAGNPIPFDRDRLKVIAFVVFPGYDYGTVFNANRARVGDPEGSFGNIGNAVAPTAVATQVYDLLGRPVSHGYMGVTIRRTLMSDGSIRTLKTVYSDNCEM